MGICKSIMHSLQDICTCVNCQQSSNQILSMHWSLITGVITKSHITVKYTVFVFNKTLVNNNNLTDIFNSGVCVLWVFVIKGNMYA